MVQIAVVAGARPNFMKIAPLLRAMRERDSLRPVLVHTGQHYDDRMSRVFFDELGIPAPDAHLGVGSGTHGAQTARVLESFEGFLLQNRDISGVVVVGDINSTMACTLAAVKLGISVAHVEAGLRSFDRGMPEEINRVVTDSIADLLLVSEPAGERNLRKEGIPEERVHYIGNVMIDTLVHELPEARELQAWDRFGVEPGRYALVTMHRPANVDDEDRLAMVVRFLQRLSRVLPVIFPVHPRTRERLRSFGMDAVSDSGSIHLLEPLGYRENLSLMTRAGVVVTDSGGIQEETTFLGVPCLTARENTERPATIELGTNTLIGFDFDAALQLVHQILNGSYKRGTNVPGWDGRAAERIVTVLEQTWAGAMGNIVASARG